MKDHNLVEPLPQRDVLVSERPVKDRDGRAVDGLHATWITLNNPRELNSYTTAMAKAQRSEIVEMTRRRAELGLPPGDVTALEQELSHSGH